MYRKQIFISDNQWLKSMITHMSTGLTTAYNIRNKSDNKNIKKYANQMIIMIENDIKNSKKLLRYK